MIIELNEEVGLAYWFNLISFAAIFLQIFRGYCDDYRNTDNAWIETLACNFHDEDGTVFESIRLSVSICYMNFIFLWLYVILQLNFALCTIILIRTLLELPGPQRLKLIVDQLTAN